MCIQMVKELVYKIYSRPMGGFLYDNHPDCMG